MILASAFPLSPTLEQLPYLCEKGTSELQCSLERCLTQAGSDWDACVTSLCAKGKNDRGGRKIVTKQQSVLNSRKTILGQFTYHRFSDSDKE